MGDLPISILPSPNTDALALQLSEQLQQKIYLAIVENGGLISFERYMQMALYEPGLGYYSAGLEKFGEGGDFVTAPEISSLFSRCLAKQCQQVLAGISGHTCILELGPGSGAMALDILRELDGNHALPSIYYMLEPSADLRQRQQQKISNEIPHLAERVVWLEQLPTKKIEGVILANEVIDAMPVKRIIFADEIEECMVTCEAQTNNGKKFRWSKQALDAECKKKIHAILDTLKDDLPLPYIADLNFYIEPWLNSLNAILANGLILISDYGYPRHDFFHPQRHMGSLICHYRHHAHDDPFLYPGLQDITASVDFTAIAEVAVDIGLELAGFTTQAHFLISCGLDKLISEHEINISDNARITQQISQLTMPGEMGEKFKFIGLSKSLDMQFQGFNLFDQRARL